MVHKVKQSKNYIEIKSINKDTGKIKYILKLYIDEDEFDDKLLKIIEKLDKYLK